MLRANFIATLCLGLCALHTANALPAAPPAAAALAAPAEPLRIAGQYTLALPRPSAAKLQTIQTDWRTLALQDMAGAPQASAGAAREWITTGGLSWRITPEGTQLVEQATGRQFRSAALTTSNVRSSDILYSARQGIVWFYGDALYRYRISSRTLERLQPANTAIANIRRAVLDPSGLWLAADSGVFLLDAEMKLKQIMPDGGSHGGAANLVAGDDGVWFATAEARLVHVTLHAANKLEIAVSTKQLPGVAAEMVAAKNGVWMLLGSHHGSDYQLAFVEAGSDRLNVLDGKYYSLRNEDGRLLARNYSTLFEIDPAARTITRFSVDEEHLLERARRASAILFLGSSYVYKDGCEIVEHGRFDLSKGWSGTHVSILDVAREALLR